MHCHVGETVGALGVVLDKQGLAMELMNGYPRGPNCLGVSPTLRRAAQCPALQ